MTRPLVNLLTAADVDGPVREIVDSGLAQYGQLLNTWGALLNRPEIFAAYLPFLRAVAGPGLVDARLKDLSALLVGHLNGCRYTVSHRTTSARRNGASEAELVLVTTRQWAAFPRHEALAFEYTARLTVDPVSVPYAAQPQLVPDELLAELKSLYTDPQIVELTMSIAVWNALARFHRVMGFALDMPAPPLAIDPAAGIGR